jgi:hypothetical protein
VHTLTRSEVARRLGKSIATVRRLEYRVLFPVRDARGVHRFDESDVERARRDPASLRLFARSQWLEDKVLDDSWRLREVPAGPRRTEKTQAAAERSVQLANDLQATLYALLLRFDPKRLRACGFDADLLARAFDVVQRLRNQGAQRRAAPT